jgi:MFS family permease
MRDPSPPPPSLVYLEHAAARRIILGILLIMLLAALDQVMVATALPTIAESLGDFDNLPWVVTADLLCGTAATPLYGKLSDIHGRRTMMLIAMSIYAAGSLACALAPTMLALIGGRALQGLGGGGLMPLVQTIIGDVASPRDRPRYQAYTSSTFILSTIGGPLLGGFIAQHFHWSWIFWVNLPICAASFLLAYNVLRGLPRNERPHKVDVLGAVVMLGAALPLMLALSWGGRRYPWTSPEMLMLFAASVALWAFFAWRVTTAHEPFIPLSVVRDRAIRGGIVAGFFAVGSVIALTIYLPLYGQTALGLSITESAWAIAALQGGATVGSIFGGRLLIRFAHYKRVPLVAILVSIATLVPLALAPAAFSPLTAIALITLVGVGVGPMFPFTVVVVQNAVAQHQLGIATGAMNFFRSLGSAFIVAGFGAIVLSGTPAMRGMPGSAMLPAGQAADAFGLVFAAAILCLAVGFVATFVLDERPLRGAEPIKCRVGKGAQEDLHS